MENWREVIPVGAYYVARTARKTSYGQVLRHEEPTEEEGFVIYVREHTKDIPDGVEGSFSALKIVRLIDVDTFHEAKRAGFPDRDDLDEPPLLMSPELADFYVEFVRKASVARSTALEIQTRLDGLKLTEADKRCAGIFVSSCVLCPPWVWRRLTAGGEKPLDFLSVQLGSSDVDWVEGEWPVPYSVFEKGVCTAVINLAQALVYRYKSPASLRAVSDLASGLAQIVARELQIIENRMGQLLDAAARVTFLKGRSGSLDPDQLN